MTNPKEYISNLIRRDWIVNGSTPRGMKSSEYGDFERIRCAELLQCDSELIKDLKDDFNYRYDVTYNVYYSRQVKP